MDQSAALQSAAWNFQQGGPIPPAFSSPSPGGGGSGLSFMPGLASSLTGVGGIASAVSAGLSALGGVLGGGPSNASSDYQGGSVAQTGWGAFNAPFSIATGASKLESRNTGTFPTELDMSQTGPSGARSPLLTGGDNSGFVTIAVVGLVGLVIVKALRARKG